MRPGLGPTGIEGLPRRPPPPKTRVRVNLILFEPTEINAPLPCADRRARHIIEVLRCQIGDSFEAGLINGPCGRATLTATTATTLTLTFAWGETPPPPFPIALIVGLPRPQTARDILRDATTLGVTALHFVRTEKAPASYAQSTLWTSGEWRRHLLTGAEQAVATRLPDVTHGATLAEAVAASASPGTRIALDNYESPQCLSACPIPADVPLTLAIGAERGWSARERELLRENRFALAHLGPRVLRTETAAIAALAIVRAKLGLM